MDFSAIDPIKLFVQLLIMATPLIFAAIGETVVEKSGVLNLGVEGMMIMGAMAGFALAVNTGNVFVGFVAGGIIGALTAMAFAILTQYFRTNQVATGLALTLFGLGLSGVLGEPYLGQRPPSSTKLASFEHLKDVPIHTILLVAIGIFSVVGVAYFLSKTRKGLILRSVGENHEAAHSIGYNVIKIRIMAILFGGFMAGVGGAFVSLSRTPLWEKGMTAGIGWIALALVVFGSWKPYRVLAGAYLFGGVTLAQLNLQGLGVSIRPEYLTMLPYVMTIIVLVIMSGRAGRSMAPASLGQIFQAKS